MMGFQSTKILVHRTLCCAALLASTTSVMAYSASFNESKLRISGFGTLGLTHTSGPNELGYRRDVTQSANSGGTRADIDSRLGLQLNYSITPQFELVGQVVAKRRSKYALSSDNIEWAFAAYRPQPDLTMRLGRLNVDAFLLADYRNVGFAYSYARPPVEFYGYLPKFIDGVDISKDVQLNNSLWRIKAFAGRSKTGDLAHDSRITIKPMYGLKLSREANGLRLRAGIAYVGLYDNPNAIKPLIDGLSSIQNIPSPSVAAQAMNLRTELDLTDNSTIYKSFAVNYELQEWLFTLELAKVSGYGGFTSGYAALGKRFDAITLFGGVSYISSSQESNDTIPDWEATLTPIIGAAAAQQAQFLGATTVSVINQKGASQHNILLGGRWDFRSDMALKIQWDHTNVDEYAGSLLSNSTLKSSNVDVFSLLLDFVF